MGDVWRTPFVLRLKIITKNLSALQGAIGYQVNIIDMNDGQLEALRNLIDLAKAVQAVYEKFTPEETTEWIETLEAYLDA